MYVNSQGIVFRHVKAAGGRKIILLFTEKYGKISVGTSINEKSKTRSSLALRPFTQGNYQIFQGRNYYNLDRAETIRSFYGIGEDIDKYMAAAYVLEMTEKVVPEELSQPGAFKLLIEFLKELEDRKTRHLTLVLAYEIKLIKLLGCFPELNRCTNCGKAEKSRHFAINLGGLLCEDCFEKLNEENGEILIFTTKFDIINVIDYFAYNPLKSFRKIALKEEDAIQLQNILRQYISYHLGVEHLKSEPVFLGGLQSS